MSPIGLSILRKRMDYCGFKFELGILKFARSRKIRRTSRYRKVALGEIMRGCNCGRRELIKRPELKHQGLFGLWGVRHRECYSLGPLKCACEVERHRHSRLHCRNKKTHLRFSL